jgi:hypothetical protein
MRPVLFDRKQEGNEIAGHDERYNDVEVLEKRVDPIEL